MQSSSIFKSKEFLSSTNWSDDTVVSPATQKRTACSNTEQAPRHKSRKLDEMSTKKDPAQRFINKKPQDGISADQKTPETATPTSMISDAEQDEDRPKSPVKSSPKKRKHKKDKRKKKKKKDKNKEKERESGSKRSPAEKSSTAENESEEISEDISSSSHQVTSSPAHHSDLPHIKINLRRSSTEWSILSQQ